MKIVTQLVPVSDGANFAQITSVLGVSAAYQVDTLHARSAEAIAACKYVLPLSVQFAV